MVGTEFKFEQIDRLVFKKKSKLKGFLIGSAIGFVSGYLLGAPNSGGINVAPTTGLFIGAPVGGLTGLISGSYVAKLRLNINNNQNSWALNRPRLNDILKIKKHGKNRNLVE